MSGMQDNRRANGVPLPREEMGGHQRGQQGQYAGGLGYQEQLGQAPNDPGPNRWPLPRPTDDVASPAFDIHVRLAALKAEHDKGRALIESLDAQRAAVARGLVKVEGAMELLLEMGAKVEEKP